MSDLEHSREGATEDGADLHHWRSRRLRMLGTSELDEREEVFHTVLQQWDLRQQQGWRAPWERLPESRRVAEVGQWLERFAESPERARLNGAEECRSAVELLMPWPTERKRPLVRGVVDMLWADAEGWHALFFTRDSLVEGKKPWDYRPALALFAMALREWRGRPLADVTLYSLTSGRGWVDGGERLPRQRIAKLFEEWLLKGTENE